MLALKTTIITRGLVGLPPKRGLGKVLKPMWNRVGHYWHEHLLPKHFTIAGGQEYGYRPRGIKYKRRHGPDVMYDDWKQKKFGHRDPLVASGRLKQMATTERRVSSTAKGVKVRLRVPGYVWYKGQAKELTKVSRADRNLMKAAAKRFLVDEIAKARRRGPVRKRRTRA